MSDIYILNRKEVVDSKKLSNGDLKTSFHHQSVTSFKNYAEKKISEKITAATLLRASKLQW